MDKPVEYPLNCCGQCLHKQSTWSSCKNKNKKHAVTSWFLEPGVLCVIQSTDNGREKAYETELLMRTYWFICVVYPCAINRKIWPANGESVIHTLLWVTVPLGNWIWGIVYKKSLFIYERISNYDSEQREGSMLAVLEKCLSFGRWLTG